MTFHIYIGLTYFFILVLALVDICRSIRVNGKSKDYFNKLDITYDDMQPDEDYGISDTYASYVSHITSNFNYDDYQVVQNIDKDSKKLVIDVVSPRMPYFVTKEDVSVSFDSNMFNIKFVKGKMSPSTNIGMADPKSIKFSDLNLLIYPMVQLNSTSPNFKFDTKVSGIDGINSDSQFMIFISVEQTLFVKHEKWTQNYDGENLIRVNFLKSNKEKREDRSMQVESKKVVVDMYVPDQKDPNKFTHLQNDFASLKLASKYYDPNKPFDLYKINPDVKDKQDVTRKHLT